MVLNRNVGCDTPQSAETRDIEQQLVHLFAPHLYFTPGERFFPVDLRSTIRASSLWLADLHAKPPAANQETQPGSIDPGVDLPTKTGDHFTTVVGFGTVQRSVPPEPPFVMPIPKRSRRA